MDEAELLPEEPAATVEVVEHGRLMGATVVAFPAFPNARLELTGPADENGLVPFLADFVPEGEQTGDGRFIEADALTWRELPLPLNWLKEDAHGGPTGASVTVGRIDSIAREAGMLSGAGVIDSTLPDGQVVLRHIETGALRGVSVDMDDITARIDVVGSEPSPGVDVEDDEAEADEDVEDDEPTPGQSAARRVAAILALAAERAASAASKPETEDQPVDDELDGSPAATGAPAHTGAVVMALVAGDSTVTDDPGQPLHVTLAYYGDFTDLSDEQRAEIAAGALDAAAAQGPFDVTVHGRAYIGKDDPPAAALLVEDARLNDLRSFMPDLGTETHPHFVPHVTIGYGLAVDDLAYAYGDTLTIDRLQVAFGDDVTVIPLGAPVEDAPEDALTAAAVPVAPPAAWFAKPSFTGPQPIVVTEDGRVYGHVATWGTCHRGRPGCVTPPMSASGYAHFLLGATRTAEGDDLPTGPITLDGTHAGLDLNARSAQRHYEDTSVAVADVNVGEDEFGIWCAGSLRPGVKPPQVRSLRAAPPSGDWRPVGGALEMIAVHGVNAPGFPVPRFHMKRGERVALVAGFAPDEVPSNVVPLRPSTLDMLLSVSKHPATQRSIIVASVNLGGQ